ncbi:MAG: MliC family protein [Paracoccaceae bacterium]
MTRIGSLALPALCVLAWTGHAHAEDRTVAFLCDRGVNISVQFAGDTAVLTYEGQSVRLSRQETGSGYLYSNGSHRFRGKGTEATWTDAAGQDRLCRDQDEAMKQPQVEPSPVTLAGTKWRLIHFQSSDDAIGTIVPPRVERYTAEFGADGRLSLQLDCNRASSNWTSDEASQRGGSLALSPGPMTRAACGAGALDSQIARDLVRIRSYTIIGSQMSLALEADGGIYLWGRIPSG